MISKSTHYAKQGEVQRNWVLVDADGAVLGRLATQIAMILRGKNKPQFTPNSDCGDFVVVINADKVQLTGNKADTKTYYRHSGYNGGLMLRASARLGEAPGEGHRARRSRHAAQDHPRPCPDDPSLRSTLVPSIRTLPRTPRRLSWRLKDG